jgi:hypothetical protein
MCQRQSAAYADGFRFALCCVGGSDLHFKAQAAITIVALSATACGYAIKTTSDYDSTANFANYHTFFMMKGNSSGNPLLDQPG